MDYVFIDNNETVRAWLLSNPVHDDPLDLMGTVTVIGVQTGKIPRH